ncbi:MAG: CDGSH iron-sulfur domain-containing protein [Betaproteobacteria bacterium]|nr:CDGSH iron-sulfur domain-containing protein [Betaproteobacteria bacterium]MBI3938641.1 CDGSH iron-sulfur domain-containing protein [Betaproteobacteria bacterium]
MTDKLSRYESDAIAVTYDVRRCLHAAECIHALPKVFDPGRRPWIDPRAAPAAEIARIIERCPTGALKYERKDGGAPEALPHKNAIALEPDGPLCLRGAIELLAGDGTLIARETRVALCRCRASEYKPYCDGCHTKAGFHDAGTIRTLQVKSNAAAARPGLAVTIIPDGPLHARGTFEIVEAQSGVAYPAHETWLCRCGASANKPFCDGSHKRTGFKG